MLSCANNKVKSDLPMSELPLSRMRSSPELLDDPCEPCGFPSARGGHQCSDDLAAVSALLLGPGGHDASSCREDLHASARADYCGRFVSQDLDYPVDRSGF